MFDIIGAGATANCSVDWHEVWMASVEAEKTTLEIDSLCAHDKRQTATSADALTTTAPWTVQLRILLQREFQNHWRDPTYLLSKVALNVLGGLFIGFTFFQTENSLQGVQNKIFVCGPSWCLMLRAHLF